MGCFHGYLSSESSRVTGVKFSHFIDEAKYIFEVNHPQSLVNSTRNNSLKLEGGFCRKRQRGQGLGFPNSRQF